MNRLENLYAEKVGGYIIRRCNKKDLPNVIKVNLVSLPEHYSDYFFEDLLNNSPESFYVVEKDEFIVGYIMCRIEYGFSNHKRFSLTRKGHIVSFAILEEHRRRGLGIALVKRAIEGLRMRECKEVFLEVRVSNIEAVNLYKKLSFEVISSLDGYYRDREAAYLMAINLTD